MRVLRLADLAAAPWKNGAGSTREYLCHPPGVGTGSFFWRVSRARVDHHCAFSVFPGIDRTLTVVEGETIDLCFSNRNIRLDRSTPPYSFRGEEIIFSRIPGAAIEDLNVMTDRAHWRHRVTRQAVDESVALDLAGDHALVVAVTGLNARAAGASVDLAAGDALHFDGAARLELAPRDGPGEALLVRLDHVAVPRV